MTKQQLIKVFYSGQLDQSFQYMHLIVEAVSVLVGGIILWKLSSYLHQKKLAKRAENSYFGTEFSKRLKSKN